MKEFLILSLMVSATLAGVGRRIPQEEERVIELYKSACSNPGRSDGAVPVYCKTGIESPDEEIVKRHEVRADDEGSTASQIVFVRPKSKIFRHQIILTGNSENRRNTSIFVLPQKDDHQIDITDKRVTTTHGDKPHLYYLTRDPLENQQNPHEDTFSVIEALNRKPFRRVLRRRLARPRIETENNTIPQIEASENRQQSPSITNLPQNSPNKFSVKDERVEKTNDRSPQLYYLNQDPSINEENDEQFYPTSDFSSSQEQSDLSSSQEQPDYSTSQEQPDYSAGLENSSVRDQTDGVVRSIVNGDTRVTYSFGH